MTSRWVYAGGFARRFPRTDVRTTMPDPIRILEALSIAGLTAAVLVLVFGWPWRTPNPVQARIGGVLGVGAGIYAGCWELGALPNWPPREDQDRLLFILVPAVVLVETVIAPLMRPKWLPWLLRLAIAASAPRILLHGTIYLSDLSGPNTREWSPAQAALILGGLSIVLLAVWCAMWLLVKRSGCHSVPIVLALVCAGASVTVMLSGYASGGQSGIAMTAALVGVVAGSLVLRGTPQMNGVVGVGVVGLFSLLVVGRFFGELSTANALLLFGAPLLAWGAEIPLVRRGGSISLGLVRVILPAIPVAVALLFAQHQFVADASGKAASSSEATADDYSAFGK
jgi:hypothetical protein